MTEALAARYWCHMCSQMVNPVMEAEIKCPFCDGGFVEEMGDGEEMDDASLGSDPSLSLWAPILHGMMGGHSRRHQRFGREEEEDDDDNDDDDSDDDGSILRRRIRSSAILQLLRSLRDDSRPESENLEGLRDRDRDRDRERDRDRDSLILINAFNQSVVLQGSFEGDSNNDRAGASLGDYYVGTGLDLLLQHLAENDPNQHGTPPAKKEDVEALPTVKIGENASCPVCLEDFEIESEAREMPCKHRFHSDCILRWLELHSSCPVCRFQLPADESKDSSISGNGSNVEGSSGNLVEGGRSWVMVPWRFNRGNSSSNPSSSTSGRDSRANEN